MMHRGRPVFYAPPDATSILALLAAIEKRGPGDPALVSFRSALTRKGREAEAAGGPEALTSLLHEVAEADFTRADARLAILLAAWGELLPGPAGRARL